MISTPLWRLLRYGKPYRARTGIAIAASILNTLFDLAPPYLIGLAVDVVVSPQVSLLHRAGVSSASAQLLVLSLLTVLIWGLESLTQYIADQIWRNLAQTLQHELRIDAYSNLQALDLVYFEDRSTGTLLSILNDDVNQLEHFLNTSTRDLISFFTRVIAVSASFILLAPRIAWLAMLPVPFILWGTFAFQSRLAPRYDAVREQAGFISDRLTHNLTGIATIKSFTTETYERDRLHQESDAYRKINGRAIALSVAIQPVLRFLILLGFVSTLYLGGKEVLVGRLSVGTYGFMVFIVQDLLWPFTELSEIMDDYQRAMASVRRIFGLLDMPILMSPHGLNTTVKPIKGAVEFNAITFAYRPHHPILKNLSLTVPAGTTIGIVGATGSGKSTLTKLLLRFYDVQQGQILIDGTDLRDFDLKPCAVRLAGSVRMCSYFTALSQKTSVTAALRRLMNRLCKPPNKPPPTHLSSSFLKGMRRLWESGGKSFLVGKGSELRSPAPFSKIRPFSYSMKRPQPLIMKLRRLFRSL